MLTLTDRVAADNRDMTATTHPSNDRPQRPATAEARADVARWTEHGVQPVESIEALYGEPKMMVIDYLPLMDRPRRNNLLTTRTVSDLLFDLGKTYRDLAATQSTGTEGN